VVAAIEHAHEARVYDSSGQSGRDFLEVARYQYRTVLGETRWPKWAPLALSGEQAT